MAATQNLKPKPVLKRKRGRPRKHKPETEANRKKIKKTPAAKQATSVIGGETPPGACLPPEPAPVKQKAVKTSLSTAVRLKDLSKKLGIPSTRLKEQLLSYALDQVYSATHISVDLWDGSLVIGAQPTAPAASFGNAPSAISPEEHPSHGLARRTRGGEDPDAFTEIDMSGLDDR